MQELRSRERIPGLEVKTEQVASRGVVVALFISAIMREQQRALALDSKHEENKAGGCLIPFFGGTLWWATNKRAR